MGSVTHTNGRGQIRRRLSPRRRAPHAPAAACSAQGITQEGALTPRAPPPPPPPPRTCRQLPTMTRGAQREAARAGPWRARVMAPPLALPQRHQRLCACGRRQRESARSAWRAKTSGCDKKLARVADEKKTATQSHHADAVCGGGSVRRAPLPPAPPTQSHTHAVRLHVRTIGWHAAAQHHVTSLLRRETVSVRGAFPDGVRDFLCWSTFKTTEEVIRGVVRACVPLSCLVAGSGVKCKPAATVPRCAVTMLAHACNKTT